MTEDQVSANYYTLSYLNCDNVTQFLIPCFMLLEKDMLLELFQFLLKIQANFMVGFVQSFVTLTRQHQQKFVESAKMNPSGEHLASWMADIFFAPVSIISIPKTTATVDLTSPVSSPPQRHNSVFSGSGSSTTTPVRVPQPTKPNQLNSQQSQQSLVGQSSQTAQTAPVQPPQLPQSTAQPSAKPPIGTILPGYPKGTAKYKKIDGTVIMLHVGTVTGQGVLQADRSLKAVELCLPAQIPYNSDPRPDKITIPGRTVTPPGAYRPQAANQTVQSTSQAVQMPQRAAQSVQMPHNTPQNVPVAQNTPQTAPMAQNMPQSMPRPPQMAQMPHTAPQNVARPPQSAPVAQNTSQIVQTSESGLLGTILPGYSQKLVRIRYNNGQESMLQEGTVIKTGVLTSKGVVPLPDKYKKAKATPGTQSAIQAAVGAVKAKSKPRTAQAPQTASRFLPGQSAHAPDCYPNGISQGELARIREAEAQAARMPVPVVAPVVVKPFVKAPTPQDPSTALIKYEPCLSILKVKVFMLAIHVQLPELKVRHIVEENSVDSVLTNLSSHKTALKVTWDEYMVPVEASFNTLERAIVYAMTHAFQKGYQLIPRFEENTTILHCDRMAKDGVDRALYPRGGKSNRHNCGFVLRVDEQDGVFTLKHGKRTKHNHMPCLESSSLLMNKVHFRSIDQPSFSYEDATRLQMHDRCIPEEVTDPKDKKQLKQLREACLEGGTPYSALWKLLSAPFIRARVRVNNHDAPEYIFLHHQDSYRLWKTFPEILLVDNRLGWLVGGKFQRLITFTGVDSNDQGFPIAMCLVETTKKAQMDLASWNWVFKQLKELCTDYKVSEPSFIQNSCSVESCKSSEKAFNGYTFMDQELQTQVEDETVSKYYRGSKNAGYAINAWHNVVFAEDEYMMERTLSKSRGMLCPKGEKKFLGDMKKHMYRAGNCMKQENQHFDVYQNSEYPGDWSVKEKPANIFELVRSLLHSVAEQCQEIGSVHAESSVTLKQQYSSVLDNVARSVSTIALDFVEKELVKMKHVTPPKYSCGYACNYMQGFPCVHQLYDLTRQKKKLKLDDFHPHWRNLYACLTPTMLGGTFAEKWEKLETGVKAYEVPNVVEVFKTPRVVKPKVQGGGPQKKQKVN